jgi:RNA polymerase sigma-54 factor
MAYSFGQSQRLETGISLRVDPRVVVASQILQLNSGALEAAIESELSENPALERTEGLEPISLNEVLSVIAPNELKPWSDSWESKRSLPSETEDTWVDMAVSSASLIDQLSVAVRSRLEPRLHRVADHLIGSLDERGYLTTPDEELALECGCSIEDVEVAIKALHCCEPAGIGARSVIECLLLQLAGSSSLQKLCRAIVRYHLDELTARRPERIAKRLQVDIDLVERAFDHILSMTPYPILGFSGNGTCLASKSAGVIPDLVITHTELGWQVEATGADPNVLKVDAYYAKRLTELKKANKNGTDGKSEVRHLATFVQRAEDFIDGLRNRKVTLERIGKLLVEVQAGFLSTADYGFLRPLTRSELAKRLGVHESTVSRATSGKFVQLPDGETVSFDVFFKPALRVQKMIEEILNRENPGNPLSDEQIAQLLSEKGVCVARRTVNKYRDRRKLLSSRKRRVA